MTAPHFEILDKKRKQLLPYFRRFKDRLYLAGGTGLALQLAHRDSIDFDFFTADDFDSDELLREVKKVFAGHSIEVIQAGNKTLNLIIDENVRASFFCVKDKLIKPAHDYDYLNVADVEDIACMKIAALPRAEFKDYVDLFYIFKLTTLKKIIADCGQKYANFNAMVYLKALVSFSDINITGILFRKGKRVRLSEIKKDFEKRVGEYLNSVRSAE